MSGAVSYLVMETPVKRTSNPLFKKPAAMGWADGKLSYVQRQAFNELLYYAKPDLDKGVRTHRLPYKEFSRRLKIDPKSRKYVRQTLHKIHRTRIVYDVVGRDGDPRWQAAPSLERTPEDPDDGGLFVLPHVNLTDENIIEYSFAGIHQEMIQDPRVFTLIEMNRGRRVRGKAPATLIELCYDIVPHRGTYGESPYYPLETLQRVFGTGYKGWKEFRPNVMAKAIKAMASHGLRVEYVTDVRGMGKTVTHVKLKVWRQNAIGAPDEDEVYDPGQQSMFDSDENAIAAAHVKLGLLPTEEREKIYGKSFAYLSPAERSMVMENPTSAASRRAQDMALLKYLADNPL